MLQSNLPIAPHDFNVKGNTFGMTCSKDHPPKDISHCWQLIGDLMIYASTFDRSADDEDMRITDGRRSSVA